MPERRSCAVVGLGNIGSHAARFVARLPDVGRVILVDPDVVEESNMTSQSVRHSDVGRPKAVVTGRRLRATRPDLEVAVHACRLEDVPLGALRADVILGCLDSRASRMALNERSIALGSLLVDAGVAASGLLARVSVLGNEGPCLECGWDDAAYAGVETVYACAGATAAAASTSAPAFLGATAAAIQVARCSELLDGAMGSLATETVLALGYGKLFVSSLRARATCRMAPHRAWKIERVAVPPASVELKAAFELGPPCGAGEERSIEFSRGPFATMLRCVGCGAERPLLRLASSLTRNGRRCRACGEEMSVGGMDLRERLERDALERAQLERSVESLGARVGDVMTVRAGEATRHYEFTMPPRGAFAAGAER